MSHFIKSSEKMCPKCCVKKPNSVCLLPFVMCHRLSKNLLQSREKLCLNLLSVFGLQNVGVDRSREEALRTVPNHL